jgi:hypothetical protein
MRISRRGSGVPMVKGQGPMLKRWRDRRKVNELARLLAALDALAADR